jgi:acid phosphatase class B
MRKTVIFDLDGTLALIDERRTLATKPNGKLNWKVFFEPTNIGLDKPNIPVIEMAKMLKSQGHSVVIFSGRDSISRNETIEWLNKHSVPFDVLKMRPEGSHTPDDVLKKNWLDKLFPIKSDILCVFDDRDKVVKMWRENGISCFQVAPGNF